MTHGAAKARWFLVLGSVCACAAACAAAAEIQVRTNDGQVLQGEHLGTKDGVVRLQTRYGVVAIPELSIVTLTAVKIANAEAPAAGAPAAAHVFEQPKAVNVTQLVARRLAASPPPEPGKAERQEIFRLIRDYTGVGENSRQRIIRSLQRYGLMALPFISSGLLEPVNRQNRIEIFEGLAVPGEHLTTAAFAELHGEAQAALAAIASAPPPSQPAYLSQEDRKRPLSKAEWLKLAADNVVRIEGYAATAGGPYNALWLLQIHEKRYGGPQTDPLLADVQRDRARLAAAAAGAARALGEWTGANRVMLAEEAFPLLFKDNEDLASLAQALLKKVLPSGYPKWDAPQNEWADWWLKAKPGLEKTGAR